MTQQRTKKHTKYIFLVNELVMLKKLCHMKYLLNILMPYHLALQHRWQQDVIISVVITQLILRQKS